MAGAAAVPPMLGVGRAGGRAGARRPSDRGLHETATPPHRPRRPAEMVGKHLGHSDWHTIDQEQINRFADATGDHQWIHVDVERAKSGPVRHDDRPRLPDAVAGADLRVPDPQGRRRQARRQLRPQQGPVPGAGAGGLAGADGGEIAAVEPVTGGLQVTLSSTFEIEGQPKPACVAEILFRYYE